jgi:hypothetical protein
LNLYTYVVNNPVRYIDPSGNMHEEGMGGGGGNLNGGMTPRLSVKPKVKAVIKESNKINIRASSAFNRDLIEKEKLGCV